MPPFKTEPRNELRSLWQAALVLLCWLTIGLALAQALPADVRREIIPAVVQVIPLDDETLEPIGWSGSGTIISPDGYILTNFHVAGDLDTRQALHWHAISVTSDLRFADQPPRHLYWAEFVAGDPTYDLALLKITQYADETPVPADFTVPAVAIGDSNQVLLGDPLTIIGYPGISGETITLTAGIMSGWLGEDWTTGGKQWIKTDAKIAHGNSGGAVFNLRGELVGVPTAGQTVQHAELDVEEQAYVRPIGLAWALIGPNVANVRRGNPTRQAEERTVPTPATPTDASTAPRAQELPVNPLAPQANASTLPPLQVGAAPQGMVGGLAIGQKAIGALAGNDQGATYHTFTVEVPPGTSSLTVTMQADIDLDLAVKYGAEIVSYGDDGDWLERDVETASSATLRLQAPAAGRWYVDVFNMLGAGSVGKYTLEVR